jgi:8-oxo-dGTP diphosphatase
MQNYVVGFCFSVDHSHVAIILKNRPVYQAGLYNGIGGKVENDEKSKHAMSREFEEETGVHILSNNWQPAGIKTDNETYYIDVFYSRTDQVYDCRTIEDEEVHVVKVSEIDNHEFYDDAKEIIKNLDKTLY